MWSRKSRHASSFFSSVTKACARGGALASVAPRDAQPASAPTRTRPNVAWRTIDRIHLQTLCTVEEAPATPRRREASFGRSLRDPAVGGRRRTGVRESEHPTYLAFHWRPVR